MKQSRDSLMILLAACLWGIISVFIRILNAAGLHAMQCVAVRAAFTAVIMLLYLLLRAPEKLKIHLKDLPWFLGIGILSIVMFNYCYFEAIQVIGGAAIPALLLYTAPVFVMLISAVLFHEKLTKRKLAAVFGALLGLGLVTGAFTGNEELSARAVLLGLGSGLGYALYSIFGKKLTEHYDSLTITFYTFAIAAAVTVPTSGVLPGIRAMASWHVIAAAIGLAVVSTVVPYLLYTSGLRRVEAGKASILATVEPFTAAIVGALQFHEQFTVPKIAGMLLILAAIVFLNLDSSCGSRTASGDTEKEQGTDDATCIK